MGLIELVGAILSRSTQSIELSSQNVANMTTSGYKTRHVFPALVEDQVVHQNSRESRNWAVDFAPGKLKNTGNSTDLALTGSGFFVVANDRGSFYTRTGQFHLDTDGHLATPGGLILQSPKGALEFSQSAQVQSDGTVVQDGQPTGSVSVVNFADPRGLVPAGDGLFAATDATDAQPMAAPQIVQGSLEASNVSTAD